MFDGTIKRVENIVVGDRLMGPDSNPRTVLALCRGRDEMFRIDPTKGDSWICNANHVMTLTGSATKEYIGRTIDIKLVDILAKKPNKKPVDYIWKLLRSGVDFSAQSDPLPIDPYLLGLWLGDGHKGVPRITNAEAEVIAYCKEIAPSMGLETTLANLSGTIAKLISFRSQGRSWKGKWKKGTKISEVLAMSIRSRVTFADALMSTAIK
jgi:hypothetical protein